jgi:hypothetical protein
VPVEWEGLRYALEKADAASLYFDSDATLDRVEKLGDLFKPVLTTKQRLPHQVTGRLGKPGP